MPEDLMGESARELFELQAAALVGQRVAEVAYWDVFNFGPEPRVWDYDDWHLAVMGVELAAESGPFCLLWTAAFFPYGVELLPNPISAHLVLRDEGPEGWQVETHPAWQSRLDAPVSGLDYYWETIDVGPRVRMRDGEQVSGPKRYTVPIALRIDFDSEPVWMVAAKPDLAGDEEPFIPGDEIMVVFSADRMRRMGFSGEDFLRPQSAR